MTKRGLLIRKFNWSSATYFGTFVQMQQDPMTTTSLSLTFVELSIWKSHTCVGH